MKRLLLIRHAESQNNVAYDRLIKKHGQTGRALAEAEDIHRVSDPELSETGHLQARLLGAAMKERLAGQTVLLVSSPMMRALRTADEIRKSLELPRARFQCIRELYEVGGCYYGHRAQPGMGRDTIESLFPIDAGEIPEEGWYADRATRETLEQARARSERVLDLIESYLQSDQFSFDVLVVVAHGDLLTRLLRLYLQMSWQQTLTFVHGNTGITDLLYFKDGDVMLNGLNDLGHLPREKRTGLSSTWRHYGRPDVTIERYMGRDRIPIPMLWVCDQLRIPLLEEEGKNLVDVLDNDRRAIHFLAMVCGEVAGYVQYDPHTNRLRHMIVHPDYRSGGIGRKLVNAVKEEAKHLGNDDLLVHAWTRSDHFYRSLGFQPEGTVSTETHTPWQPMVYSFAKTSPNISMKTGKTA